MPLSKPSTSQNSTTGHLEVEHVRIFDAFQFSEPHETEVLLAKLHVESELVEKWIVVENNYAMKGGWKGRYLERIVAEDSRFAQFRDRIVLVPLSEDFAREYKYPLRERANLLGKLALPGYHSQGARVHFEERPYFYAEQRQRDAALHVLRELSGGEGWVVVTDVDEMLDASTPSRRDLITSAIRSGAGTIRLRRRRFNWDFDNYCPAVRFVGGASIGWLTDRGVGLEDIRLRNDGLVLGPEPLVFEYSFCYPHKGIARKLETFLHADPGIDPLGRALECNHGMFGSRPTAIDPTYWYETLPADRTGAPHYILENLERLRTRNVNPDYAAARRNRYPDLFGFAN
jgi:hypothetical protein